MRSLNDKIDSFCARHPGFGIPRLMLFIIVGNAIVYVVGLMDVTQTLYSLLWFDPALFCRGQVWRLVTFALIPEQNGILFLAISLYFYYFIGSALENAWGKGKFTLYYISGMLVTALYSLVIYWTVGQRISVTATYLNFSMFFAFATLWPDQQVLLFFFIPVKMKWLALVDAAFFAVTMVRYLIMGHVALAFVPIVAMIPYLVFCGGWLFDLVRPSNIRRKTQQRARTVQFKTAVRQGERRQQAEAGVRRCAVCGRSEAEHPELEFRFCSRCAGFHCFCQDHINDHIHFTE